MGPRSEVALTIAVAVTIAVGVGLLLGTCSFQALGLGEAVARRARQSVGVDLEVSRSRFRLLDGLVLEDVTASSDLAMGRYRARLDEIRLEHRPLSLLVGRLDLTRIVLERPRVVLELGGPAARLAEPEERPSSTAPPGESAEGAEPVEPDRGTISEAPGLFRLALLPSRLLLEEGAIAIRDEKRGRELLSLDGLKLDFPAFVYDRLAVTPVHALTSKGDIAISAITVGNLRLTRMAGALKTESGRFRLGPLRFHVDAGDFEGELDVDFNSLPFRYRTSLTGASVDLGRLADMPSGGRGLGTGLVRFEGEGFGTESRNLKASGSLALEGGQLPALAWLSRIDPSLPGAGYEATAVTFEVRGGHLSFQGLRLAGSRSVLVLGGSIGFDDEVDLTVEFRTDGKAASYRLRGSFAQAVLSRLAGS